MNAPARLPLDTQAIGLMLALSLVWSFQQIALKATAADFSPMLQIAIRSGVGALLLGIFMRWRAEALLPDRPLWTPGIIVGLLFGLEYLFVGEGLRHTSAAHIVVFLYTAPIFAALGLHWRLPAERLMALQWAGIVAAFAGIVIAFLPIGQGAVNSSPDMLWGDLLALLGGIAWAATTIVIRCSGLAVLPATQTLMFQLLGGFALLLPGALIAGHSHFQPSPMVWAALAYQCIIMSFFSFLIWFWMLRRYVASQLGVLTFMTPLFAVVLGAWLLDETIEARFLIGTALVAAGITLVSSHGLIQRRRDLRVDSRRST